jgi:hypothetical protein
MTKQTETKIEITTIPSHYVIRVMGDPETGGYEVTADLRKIKSKWQTEAVTAERQRILKSMDVLRVEIVNQINLPDLTRYEATKDEYNKGYWEGFWQAKREDKKLVEEWKII